MVRCRHFTCVDHGTIVAITALTTEAQAWVGAHVQVPSYMMMGPRTFCVERNYANDIITAMVEDLEQHSN